MIGKEGGVWMGEVRDLAGKATRCGRSQGPSHQSRQAGKYSITISRTSLAPPQPRQLATEAQLRGTPYPQTHSALASSTRRVSCRPSGSPPSLPSRLTLAHLQCSGHPVLLRRADIVAVSPLPFPNPTMKNLSLGTAFFSCCPSETNGVPYRQQ